MTLKDMDYSDRFKDNFMGMVRMLPYAFFCPLLFVTYLKSHLPQSSWMMCFLTVVGMSLIQILFAAAMVSIPKKGNMFYALVVFGTAFFIVPFLFCLWMGININKL